MGDVRGGSGTKLILELVTSRATRLPGPTDMRRAMAQLWRSLFLWPGEEPLAWLPRKVSSLQPGARPRLTLVSVGRGSPRLQEEQGCLLGAGLLQAQAAE